MNMVKKFLMLVTLSAALLATGCASTGTAVEPADSTAGGWSEGYVTLSSGNTLLCLWNQKYSNPGTVDCDWDRYIADSDIPEGMDRYFVGEGGWSEEHVKLKDGRVILCLWGNRYSESGVRSCNWNR